MATTMAAENDNDGDTYDAARNSSGCYALAVREIRLEKIRSGLYRPNASDPEEVAAAEAATLAAAKLPATHRVSA